MGLTGTDVEGAAEEVGRAPDGVEVATAMEVPLPATVWTRARVSVLVKVVVETSVVVEGAGALEVAS